MANRCRRALQCCSHGNGNKDVNQNRASREVHRLNQGHASETPDVSTTRGQRILTAMRWISTLAILGATITIVRSLPIEQATTALSGWISRIGPWGSVVLALMYVVATVLMIPGTILTVAAGALFGLVRGTITVSIGSTLGASAAFLIARYFARDRVAQLARRRPLFGAIDRAIGEGGWKIVALLRLSPAIPFNIQNYLYGLTPIRFWPYVLTSWLAMLPGTFLYVYLGHVTGAAIGGGRARTTGEWAILAVGLVATAVVTLYLTRLARQKLQEQMAGSDGDAGSQTSSISDEIAPAPRSKASPAGAAGLVVAAIVMIAAATWVHFNAAAIEHWLSSDFKLQR